MACDSWCVWECIRIVGSGGYAPAASRPIIEQAMRAIASPENLEVITASDVLKDLKIKAVPGADMLQISYQFHNADYAKKVVNEMMKAYIRNNVSTNREEAVAARKFITDQLPQTEAAVSAAEVALRLFKEQHKIVVLEQEAAQAVTNTGNLNTQIDQAQAELADVQARSAELRRQMGMRPDVAVDLSALHRLAGCCGNTVWMNCLRFSMS